jgi:hypothetical protein
LDEAREAFERSLDAVAAVLEEALAAALEELGAPDAGRRSNEERVQAQVPVTTKGPKRGPRPFSSTPATTQSQALGRGNVERDASASPDAGGVSEGVGANRAAEAAEAAEAADAADAAEADEADDNDELAWGRSSNMGNLAFMVDTRQRNNATQAQGGAR